MNEEDKKKLEDATKAAETAKAEADKMKSDLAAKEEELKKLQEKEMNFGKVRKSEEEKEKEIQELKAKMTSMEQGVVDGHKNKLLKAFSGKDEELKKTIEFHYNRVGANAKTEDEIESAMKDAYLLATKVPVEKSPMARLQGAANGHIATPPGTGADSVDPEQKAWMEEFNKHGAGIKEEDLKNPKYKVKPTQHLDSTYRFN